jgi:uncharacterized protein involved in exopolysaccharide biosynthesis
MTGGLHDTPAVATTPRTKAESAPAPGDEIDLLSYAATCWRYRYVFLVVALVVAGVTYAINRSLEPTYETRFRLMGTESGLENTPASNRLNVVAFRELVESPTQAAALLSEFRLDQPPHNLTPEKFLRSHVDVEVIRDSTIIEVAVRLKDRDVVVQLARRYAERVVETAQRLNTEEIDYTAEKIKQQRDAALDRLKVAEQTLQNHQRDAQVELLREDVDALLARRPVALDLTVRIQGTRARLQQAEAELAAQQRVRNERRGLDSVETTPPAREERPGTAGELQLRGELLDPYVNPVYEAIARDVSAYRAQLAGLEQERKELGSRLQLDAPAVGKLSRLYQVEAELAALTRNTDIARDAYLNAANQYESARLQSTIRSPRLQVLDAALPPDAPVAPRSLRNTVAATLIALTLTVIAVLAFDASRRRRGEPA